MIPEILKNLSPSFSALSQVSKIAEEDPIPPGKEPLLVKVESAPANRKDGLPVWRYTLMLPGSSFSKLDIKVKEATPSVSPADIEAHGGMVKVAVEGFRSGFLDGDKGILFFANAEKIVPIAPPAAGPRKEGA